MSKLGLAADVVTYNILLNCISHYSSFSKEGSTLILFLAYTKTHRLKEAFDFLEKMQTWGHRPNVYSFGTLTKSLSHRPSWENYQKVSKLMAAFGIEPNIVVYNNLVSCLMKLGKSDELKRLIDRMGTSKIPPNTETFNILLEVYCAERDYKNALRVMESMWEGKFKFSVTSYRLLMGLFLDLKEYPKVHLFHLFRCSYWFINFILRIIV